MNTYNTAVIIWDDDALPSVIDLTGHNIDSAVDKESGLHDMVKTVIANKHDVENKDIVTWDVSEYTHGEIGIHYHIQGNDDQDSFTGDCRVYLTDSYTFSKQ